MGLPEKIYTDRDLKRAETKGRVIEEE